MTLDSSKNFGGIGAILLVVGLVGFVADPILAVLALIGLILMLIGLHGLADYYKVRGIFNNALYGFIAIVVGAVAAFASFFYLFFSTSFGSNLIGVLYPGFNGDWTQLPSLSPNTNLSAAQIEPFIIPLLSVWAILCIFLIVGAFFTWQSLKEVKAKSNIGLFATAGMLLLIGAFLTLVFFGALLMLVAFFLIAIAFFQLKPQPETPQAQTVPYPPQPTPV